MFYRVLPAASRVVLAKYFNGREVGSELNLTKEETTLHPKRDQEMTCQYAKVAKITVALYKD